jgi:hypothetical protein
MIRSEARAGFRRTLALAILLTASGGRLAAGADPVACETGAECADADPCTADICGAQGVCQHEVQPLCSRCTGDTELVDCADPDCSSVPECQPREACGNCADDDGDGLVDYEDPDCCDETAPLAVSRLKLRPTSTPARLSVKARYAASAPALFDPAEQDTSVQVSDPRGPLFCATVAASHWVHPARRLYRFEDRAGAFAGGLTKGQFEVRRTGAVTFGTRGRAMNLRATTGADVLVTIRVGDQCAQETMSLRARRAALVFP